VIVPLVVPVSITLAPASGSSKSESTIIPETVPCEKAAKPQNKKTNSSNFLIVVYLVKISAKID
jgi:hypothetical protein